jgi:hypothetical protein
VTADILFGVGTVIVLGAFALWIAIVIRRANGVDRASNYRLSADLSDLARNPDAARNGSVAPASGPAASAATLLSEPIMFSDDLPTEVTAIANAELRAEGITPGGSSIDAPDDSAAAPAASAAAPEASAAAPVSELEARLAKLKDLHARGVITDDEHAAARLNAISE